MLMQLLPSSCPYFITHQWTEPFWPGLMMAQDKHLSSHQHWLTHLCTTQAPEHGTAPQPGNDLPWFGLTSVLYWPDKGAPGSTPAQGTCPSALSTALLEVTLRLLPGKTLWNKICTSAYAGRMIGFLRKLHWWARKVAVSLSSVSCWACVTN